MPSIPKWKPERGRHFFSQVPGSLCSACDLHWANQVLMFGLTIYTWSLMRVIIKQICFRINSFCSNNSSKWYLLLATMRISFCSLSLAILGGHTERGVGQSWVECGVCSLIFAWFWVLFCLFDFPWFLPVFTGVLSSFCSNSSNLISFQWIFLFKS